ncbi:MAG: DUF1080 domain-containing protein [Verrucomicrobiales bacterium]|nr:DUF1080 domain-containing protein [Verrucomicrobiales bacterium]
MMNVQHLFIQILLLLSAVTTPVIAELEKSVPKSGSIEAFLQRYPDAIGLIAIQDGKLDTSHWDHFKATVKDGQFRVPKGDPRTKAEFGDFQLAIEFRLGPGANSGIFLRAPKEGKGRDSNCELQILDNTAKEYADLKLSQYHGSAYGLIAAKRGALKPVGEWNYQEVTVRGHRIVVELNGVTILDGDLSELDATKYLKSHPGLLRTRGRIALGGHAKGVYYRSMYLAPLD